MCIRDSPTARERAFPGPESCRKIRKPTLSIHHFRGPLFSRKKEASARPARCPFVFSLWRRVAMVPFSFSFASTSFAAGAAARASAEHFNPEAVQFAVALESLHRGSRVLRRQMHAKRLMHDDAAGIHGHDTRHKHSEEN